jgi:transposase InsO family protein
LTGVCNAARSPGCRKSKATPPPNANSRAIRSASFIIDIAEVRTARGKLHLLVAIDQTSKFPFVELHEKMARRTAGDYLRRLVAAVPYKVHTLLTDNGAHFTTPGNTTSAAPDIKAALEAAELVWAHALEYACAQNDIDHRLTKPKHPWTNGQVERMSRTIKDVTVSRHLRRKPIDAGWLTDRRPSAARDSRWRYEAF